MPKPISNAEKMYRKKVCKYMNTCTHVLTEEDKRELYKTFCNGYTEGYIDEILSGRKYKAEVSDRALILINYRCSLIHEAGKEYSKIRTEMKRKAKKGLL
jgi:hypothetical protein